MNVDGNFSQTLVLVATGNFKIKQRMKKNLMILALSLTFTFGVVNNSPCAPILGLGNYK